MVSRIVIVGAVIAAAVLLFGPVSVPNWAVVVFVLVLFSGGIAISVKRMRAEGRLVRTFWKALTGK